MAKVPQEKERWYVSGRFSELDVAEAWHIPPHVWDTLPDESKAEMVARSRVKGQMQRWDEYLAEQRRQTK